MNSERTCLDLFTGVGCFSIAARACGVRTVAMCEIKADCRHFLAANWPGVTIHDNAKTLDGRRYKGVWIVCGGPPCQPASVAGEQRGAADHRWLWPEAIRIIGESEPTWFLFENPPGIKSVGLDGVLAELEAQGYEVRTLNIPACAVNSPQRRERLWIVGHAKDDSRGLPGWHRWQEDFEPGRAIESGIVGHTKKQFERVQDLQALPERPESGRRPKDSCPPSLWSDSTWIECGDGKRRRSKPGVCGVVDGASVGLLEALGNAIVWPIAATVIRAMIQADR